MIGQTLSHYRIDEKLGEGGMGVVYRAEDLRLKRTVALKFLPPHLVADPSAKARFLKEAQAASALDHPNICTIHEIGEAEDGQLFIAMAHYGGETVAQKLKRGPLAVDEALEIARQAARGLAKAHERGIVHRDIKPANLIATEDGIWKILDFGVAKLRGATRVTGTGAVVGTVAYMSPEQAERDEVTPPSDVWSLGVVLYEMLTGRLPFRGSTPVAMLYQVLHEEPDPVRVSRPEAPPEVERIVARALGRDLGVRYGGMGELLAELEKLTGVGATRDVAAARVVEGGPAAAEATVTPPPFLTPSGEPSSEVALPPFVGRDRELAVLEGWLREALAGKGRVGFITGEAGTGKTALVREFCRRAGEAHADLIVATGNCNAHTGVGDPHLPFREILALLAGDVEAQWAGGSLSAAQATRLWSLLPSTVRALVGTGPDLVGTFVSEVALVARAEQHAAVRRQDLEGLRRLVGRRSGGAAARQEELFDQYARVIRELARDRRLVLVVDDLQWADSGSLGILFHLGRRMAGARVLVLGLYRPSEVEAGRQGERHPLVPVVNELQASLGEVGVEVGEGGDREFVESIVDTEPNRLGPAFRANLHGRTGGHALFTVELLRAMRERGALVQDEVGRWIEGPGLDWSVFPARVEAVIAERIGRLPSSVQRLLAVASVEGETFTLEVLARVHGVQPHELIGPVALELERRHRLVVGSGLLRADGQRLSRYRFRHILFQRFLYDRLTPAERAYLHEQVAGALESLHGRQRNEISLDLARHYREAGFADQTAHYLHLAGERAMASLAPVEAVAHHEGALGALLTLPPGDERDRRELDLQISLAEKRLGLGDPGTDQACVRACELAERVGTPEQLFWALNWMYWLRGHYGGDVVLGRELAERCLSIARQEDDPTMMRWAFDLVGRNAHMRGDYAESLARYEELTSRFGNEEHRSPRFSGIDAVVLGRGMTALDLWILGYPAQAHTRGAEASARAKDPVTRQLNVVYELWARLRSGDHAKATELCAAYWKAVEESGLPGIVGPTVLVLQGWCEVLLGRVDEGIESMTQGVNDMASAGWQILTAYSTGLFAHGLGLAGRAEEGLARLEEAMAREQARGHLAYEPEVHRLHGEVLRSQLGPRRLKAEAAFQRAIEVARAQEAKSWELQATVSLARLLRDTGRPAEAREILGGIYGWFTEGHDLPYLVEARELLEELESGRLNGGPR